jgi:hypothetical protein
MTMLPLMPIGGKPFMLLPLFLLSQIIMPIAPRPALAARAKKLSKTRPSPWSLTPMIGLPTIPGRTSPSIQPTLNVKTRGSVRRTFVPSLGKDGSVRFGSEYAVAAMRCADEAESSASMLVWKSTLTPVCRCRCDSCKVPWSAIVKGVQTSPELAPSSPLPSIFAEGS